MSIFFVVFFMILFSGIYIACSKQEHLLSVLLSFEFISVGLFIFMLTMFSGVDLFYSTVYITFTACEGALGLSIIVVMSRTHGGDYFKSLNIF